MFTILLAPPHRGAEVSLIMLEFKLIITWLPITRTPRCAPPKKSVCKNNPRENLVKYSREDLTKLIQLEHYLVLFLLLLNHLGGLGFQLAATFYDP